MFGTDDALDTAPPTNSPVAAPTVTCVLLLSPLRGRDGKWRTERRDFPAGDTLEAYIPTTEVLDRVAINGGVIAPEHYATHRPQDGDEIWLYPSWGLTPVEWTIIGIGLAVSLLSSVAQHFLFRPKPVLLPPQPSMTDAQERTFSFEGIRTAIGPGSVVPVVYGRHRLGGQLLAAAVDQAAIVSDDGAPTPTAVTISNITYGEPQQIVTVTATNHGFSDHQTVLLQHIQGKTGLNHTWDILVVDANAFTLLNSWGADVDKPYLGGGTATAAGIGVQTHQALTNPPTLSLFIGLCEGPIDAVLTNTIQINGQPVQNFPGVQVYSAVGTAFQPAFAEFGGARNTFSDGRTLSPAFIVYTSNASLHAFVINLVWPEGLYYLNPKGEKESNAVRIDYRYQVSGTGNWSPMYSVGIAGDRTAAVRIGIRRENLPLARYDIQIAQVYALQQDELRAKFHSVLESVTEHIPNTYAYPYTAWLGIKALATDALQGALPNITVEVRGRTVRVGTLNPGETWSDNPAWCIMDALTNPRYGRGVPDGDINLTAFAQYAANCDQIIDGELRHRLNVVLDREARAQQFFLETMGGSRGLLMKSGGLWTPRPTMTETPVCLLSWTMVSNVTLTYLRDVDAVNVMEARFANEDTDFEQDVVTWPTLPNWPPEVQKASIDLRGVTKPSRVMRALQYELNRRRYENVLLELDASPEAMMLQVHDLFRFSHPLPGWGQSGRVLEGSSTTILHLDNPVTMEASANYLVYVRHDNDYVEARDIYAVVGTVRQVTLVSPLLATPFAQTTIYVIGRVEADGNMRIFRVTDLQRKSDSSVHLSAVIHNPSIYDDPFASPLPIITTLFNPLGPPPPLVTLIATEVTRVQASGASLRVVNLSWDIAHLTSGYAPYGGAYIFRRTILATGQAGQAQAGMQDAGAISDPNDPNVNYSPLAQVRGHVLDFDDFTVISGGTYRYRVVPVSQFGVPNNLGAREVEIHIAGPTTPNFFPLTPLNLRLRGRKVGETEWDGRDCHFEWDEVPYSPLFSDTFFIQDYVVQIWAPGQLYLMHSTTVPVGPHGQSVQWTYTYEQNYENQVQAGYTSARRDFTIFVWARTNTNLWSLDPAHLSVINPPPDMSEIMPEATAGALQGIINFNQWIEPRDLHKYEVHLDTMNPPVAIYQDLSIAFQKVFALDLLPNVTYYTYILPFDTFGVGIASGTASFTPVAIDASKIDSTPPPTPTGLLLTTGTTVAPDGTINTFVDATWTLIPDEDMAGYQLSFRFPPSLLTTTLFIAQPEHSYRFAVPGGVLVHAKVSAYDRTQNMSGFSAEAEIQTGTDTTPPGAPTGLIAVGGVQKMHFLWTPPSDIDYDYAQIFGSYTNNLATAGYITAGIADAEQQGLGPNDVVYYWVRAIDRSGNVGPFAPAPTAGVQGTAGQLDNTFIKSIVANKITAGTMSALVSIGVGNYINLDGVQQMIYILYPASLTYAVLIGRLGPNSPEWGMRIYDQFGHVMFSATEGGVTAVGIKAGTIEAGHLRTDTAVITSLQQVANATIHDAHIINLTATKLIAGQISVQVSVGNSPNIFRSNIFLDGVERNITIYDDFPNIRARLGKLGAAPEDFGLQIWNQAQELMWSFTGATTAGIADFAVNNAKIANATITTAKVGELSADKITAGKINAQVSLGVSTNVHGSTIFLDGVNRTITVYQEDYPYYGRVQMGQVSPNNYGLVVWDAQGQEMWNLSSGAQTRGIGLNAVTEGLLWRSDGFVNAVVAETQVGSLGYGLLNAGDQVWLSATLTGSLSVAGPLLTVRLREDGLGGNVLHTSFASFAGYNCMTVQAVFTAGSTLAPKYFVVTIQNEWIGEAVVGAQFLSFVGLRRQR
jgi:predicted phage tail protein